MSPEIGNERSAKLGQQAQIVLAKLEQPGRTSLSLGAEAEELVLWMVERGWVDAEPALQGGFVVRPPRA